MFYPDILVSHSEPVRILKFGVIVTFCPNLVKVFIKSDDKKMGLLFHFFEKIL